LALAAAVAAAPAHAAAPLSWSAPLTIDESALSAVSCPTESLCVAVDASGGVLRTLDPTSAMPAWTKVLNAGQALSSVSCASATLCVAVGGHQALTSADGAASWSSAPIDPASTLTGVSCPAISLCVAVDQSGQALATGNPGSASWSTAKIDGTALQAVACSSASSCVAVDGAGAAFGSESPGGGAWHGRTIDPGVALSGVSCLPAGPCVAVGGGDALASANPGSGAATWSSTPIDAGGHLVAASCASSGLCVAVDDRGLALASDAPASALPTWSGSSAEPGVRLSGVSCLPGGLCAAVDALGRFLSARVPAPRVATAAPAEVTATIATLSGVVNPNDAALGACVFEYGTSAAYDHSVPCAGQPSPAGGAQLVSAQIANLSPNTTYHYRLLASTLGGTGIGEDQTFTSAVSANVALVYPHPSIHGTPAVGSHLSCQSGVPAGAARVSFVWLRDLIPIPRATGSAYTVTGGDSGHHLQCQVTASNAGGSVTARSAFVTVPVQGVLAAAGETVVGAARYRRGSVSVSIRCSVHAFAGCRIVLRLTSTGPAGVILGGARARLARGQHRVVTLRMNSTGRRLLKGRRRVSAQLTVTGTVIGVLEAVLAQRRLVLGAAARGASSDGPAHRR
jgi:hypothetical protein